ncbi:MAG: tRNA pseudouridine(38-40) synthase TruA [Muribaculaceae bacterium]|nr:tRNA pseudouridine(38-40) synthase TruA [Muribaculaceae bacterium]
MSQRYFIRLSYNGTPFHGWQSQPNAISVQETIEKAMSMIMRHEVKITGAGRTDTAVNARTMYAHFECDSAIADTDLFIKRLNSIVGRNIAIYEIIAVDSDAHARFDAVSRTYKYFVDIEKSPFSYPFSWYCHTLLDFDAMNIAAEKLYDYIDFTSFSKLHTDVATNDCKITHAHWAKEGSQWVFTITADRFLRNMVRAIVGTLVEVGRGKLTIEQFCRIIEKKDRCSAGTSMPGNALFLWDIEYPYIENKR